MRKFLKVVMTFAIFTLVSTSAFAVAIDLGDASKYNAFIKNDFNVKGTDTQGRVAIGGNLTVDGGHDIGAEITKFGMGDGPSLVVGGNIVKNNNEWGTAGFLNVYNDHPSVLGDIVYAGDVIDNSSGGGILGNLNKVAKANLPVDFNSAFAHLNQLSTDLMATTANGSTTSAGVDWEGNITGPLTFKPTSTPSDNVYVFDVTQEQINSTTEWFVEGVSDDATVLFNVTNINAVQSKDNWAGNKDTCTEGQIGCVHFSQTNISINGKLVSEKYAKDAFNNDQQQKLLFNFGNATQVNLASDMYGSVLAPNADIKANPSVIWGQVIGKSWEGNMQINYNPFPPVGTNPPTPVPTPETLWVFGLGVALLYVNRKHFIRVKRKPLDK
jgi:choice-of-anchor A domain-containing protein